jgi:hypothetical protein
MKYGIIMVVLLQSCMADKSIQVTPFTTYVNPADTTNLLDDSMLCYNKFFLVSNYRDAKKVQIQLDNFVAAFIAKNEYSPKTERIDFYFFKESSRTNLAAIQRNPREVAPYSSEHIWEHDWVCYYSVKLDGSWLRKKIKNGETIETTEKVPPKPKFKIVLTEVDTSR